MQEKEKTAQALTDRQIEQLQKIAQRINYGSITLVFQDHQLIQIDHSEKVRIKKER